MKSLHDVIKAVKICDNNETGNVCQNCPYSMTLCDGKTKTAWENEFCVNDNCINELKHDALTYLKQLGAIYQSIEEINKHVEENQIGGSTP